MSQIARRYARAAVEAAGDQATVDALSESLWLFAEAFETSATLRELLTNPAFTNDRVTTLKDLCGRLALSEDTERFISLLTQSGRIDVIADVASEVQCFADERAHRQRVAVTSAISLDAKALGRIEKAFEKRLGQNVVIDVTVDPSILGGLRCQVGDTTIDSSIIRQLDRVNELLRAEA